MGGFFYNIGKRAAPAVLKTRWIYHSLAGNDTEKIKAEYSMGCYLAYLHAQEGNLDREPKTVHWLNAHSSRLAKALVNRERRFQVRCTGTSEANAFALPGGFLYVSRPLLELCDFDDDEIAFVLAHEMGHVVRSHSFNRLLTSEIAGLLSRGGPLLKGSLKPLLSKLIHQLVTQGYSRRQEFEADKFAARLTGVSGYDPEGSIRLLRRLQAQTSEPGSAAGYFASHPPFALRIERLQNALADRH